LPLILVEDLASDIVERRRDKLMISDITHKRASMANYASIAASVPMVVTAMIAASAPSVTAMIAASVPD
jgi:hypothetical protein